MNLLQDHRQVLNFGETIDYSNNFGGASAVLILLLAVSAAVCDVVVVRKLFRMPNIDP